jgi:hypothetical protein
MCIKSTEEEYSKDNGCDEMLESVTAINLRDSDAEQKGSKDDNDDKPLAEKEQQHQGACLIDLSYTYVLSSYIGIHTHTCLLHIACYRHRRDRLLHLAKSQEV